MNTCNHLLQVRGIYRLRPRLRVAWTLYNGIRINCRVLGNAKMARQEHPRQMFNSETFNLERYMEFRPQYPTALFEEIYSHHRKYGGQWDLAHDAGTGPGIVAEELSKQFAIVAASDPSHYYLEVARARLLSSSWQESKTNETGSHQERFLFGRYTAEDMSQWLAPSTVDIVTIAEAIHWTEYDKVVMSALRVLKPGGTLAIWVYGTCPFIDQGKGNSGAESEAQELLDRIHRRWEQRVVETCTADLSSMIRFRRASQIFRSYLDVVRLDDSSWQQGSVRRHRWNSNRPAMGIYDLFGEDAHHSVIGGDDIIIDHTLDENGYHHSQLTEEEDVRWIRGYFDHLYPDLPVDDPASEELFSKLAAALGGADRKIRLRWVSAMIIATKAYNTVTSSADST